MTEKRFIIPKGYRVIKDNVTDECATFYDDDDGETFLKWLNELTDENEQLKQQLKSIEDGFKFSCTENHTEFDKDKLIVKDTHTKIHLNGRNLFIEVYIPQIDEFYRFKYTITGKSLMREFIENYNLKGDVE